MWQQKNIRYYITRIPDVTKQEYKTLNHKDIQCNNIRIYYITSQEYQVLQQKNIRYHITRMSKKLPHNNIRCYNTSKSYKSYPDREGGPPILFSLFVYFLNLFCKYLSECVNPLLAGDDGSWEEGRAPTDASRVHWQNLCSFIQSSLWQVI